MTTSNNVRIESLQLNSDALFNNEERLANRQSQGQSQGQQPCILCGKGVKLGGEQNIRMAEDSTILGRADGFQPSESYMVIGPCCFRKHKVVFDSLGYENGYMKADSQGRGYVESPEQEEGSTKTVRSTN